MGVEGALARGRVVDNGFRIGLAQRDAGFLQRGLVGLPRGVKVFVGQVFQFRTKAAHIVAGFVKLGSLADRVEDTEIGRSVCARPRGPLPAGGIVRRISIDQRVPEPLFAFLPRQKKMLSGSDSS